MYPDLIKDLIKILKDLPGVSERAATRYVFHLLRKPEKEIEALAHDLLRLKKDIALCARCYNIAQKKADALSLCVICQNKKRNEAQICLVEKISDIERIESLGFYEGVYHVLTGLLNPVKGITPQKLTFNRLILRLRQFKKDNKNPELIIALNPTREGDLTVNYLKEIVNPLGIKMTRLARGIPSGGELQYADEDTLKESFSQRKTL